MTVTSPTDGAGWPRQGLSGTDGGGGFDDTTTPPTSIGDPETRARIAAGVPIGVAVEEAKREAASAPSTVVDWSLEDPWPGESPGGPLVAGDEGAAGPVGAALGARAECGAGDERVAEPAIEGWEPQVPSGEWHPEAPGGSPELPAAPEVVAQHAFVRRAQERRRQRTARAAVGAGLAMAAGLTVAALLTARTSSGSAGQTVNSPPSTVAPGSGAGAVGTAGLAPSIEPPPTLPIEAPPAGSSSTSVGSTAP